MKIKPNPLDPGSFPSVRGRFYTRDTKFGPVVQKWPGKHRGGWSNAQMYANTEFAIAGIYSTNPMDIDYGTAYYWASKIEYVPRDLLMKAMYGYCYRVTLEDGTVLTPSRDIVSNPQLWLDLITDEPFSILVRTPNEWIGLKAEANGQVLQRWDNQLAFRAIAPPSGSGNADFYPPYMCAPGIAQNATVNLCSGAPFFLKAGAVVNAIGFYAQAATPTAKLTPVVYTRSGNTLGALIVKGPQVTGTVVGKNILPLNNEFWLATDDIVFAGAQILIASAVQAQSPSTPVWQFASVGAIPDPAPATTQTVGTAGLHPFLTRI